MVRRVLAVVLIAIVLVAATPSRGYAQNTDERAKSSNLVDSLASLVYYYAWPTAKYKRVGINGISLRSGAALVTFRLHGISALDGGDLWVDVKMTLLSTGEISDIAWGDYNGFFPPGWTWTTAKELLADMNRRNLMATPPPPAPAPIEELAMICLGNTTQRDFNYSIRWGSKNETLTLAPGGTWRFWAPASANKFVLTFDADPGDAVNTRTWDWTGVKVSSPVPTCNENTTVDLVTNGTWLSMKTRAWVPKAAHPFIANLVGADKKDVWVCAIGFKWVVPGDEHSLECIDANIGLVGIRLSKKETDRFPTVATVNPGSPAAKAGLIVGMLLVSVDGVTTEGQSTEALTPRIRGAVGAAVTLVVLDSAQMQRTFTIVRQ